MPLVSDAVLQLISGSFVTLYKDRSHTGLGTRRGHQVDRCGCSYQRNDRGNASCKHEDCSPAQDKSADLSTLTLTSNFRGRRQGVDRRRVTDPRSRNGNLDLPGKG